MVPEDIHGITAGAVGAVYWSGSVSDTLEHLHDICWL